MRHQKVEFAFTIERNEEQIELLIVGEYSPASKGATDGKYGPPIEPDEPDFIEIDSATDEDGNEIELTEEEYEKAVEEGLEKLAEMEEGCEPDYYDNYNDF